MGARAEPPAGDVEVMDAVVADVAAPEVVPPAPDAGQQVRAVGYGRRRPQPEIEVEVGGRRGRLRLADRAPALAVPGLGHQDLADLAALDLLDGLAHAGGAAALRPHLEALPRAARRLHHQPPLADIVARWLLDVDVLPRLEGEDRRRSVPVVGGGDEDRIDGAVIEDLSQV